VLRWVKKDEAARKPELDRLLPLIRFPMIHWKKAGFDEGLLSFALPRFRLYRESLQVQQMKVTNGSAPSSIQAPLAIMDEPLVAQVRNLLRYERHGL
jgi:hypothetical protein